jgi:hypothetical protein
MLEVILALLQSLLSDLQSHSRLVLENLAARHQLAVLKWQARKRKLRSADRLLWQKLDRAGPGPWQVPSVSEGQGKGESES